MDIIKGLLDIGAIKVNIEKPFIWASGIKSPIYCDNRKSIGHYDLRHAIALQLTALIRDKFPQVDLMAGTATAGIPHATSVADYMKLPLIYLRTTEKDHGTSSCIEGDYVKGAKAVVIEDLISTGGSVLKCVEHAQKAGIEILGVVSIFNYQLKKGSDNFAKAYVETHSLAYFSDLKEKLKLTDDQADFLKKWCDNPSDETIWGI